VDVVVPFAGTDRELDELRARLRDLILRAGDTLVVVDNRPSADGATADAGIVWAPTRRSSYHARNQGAARGQASWILFMDADVAAPNDLLDRYLSDTPGDRVAVLAGAIRDVVPVKGGRIARRYARMSRPLNDENTWRPGFAYAQTASAMVRRTAFESVNGFAEVRSGGDADLCFRLVEAGWHIEQRQQAVVEHTSRASVRALIKQHMRYGAGTEWLERRHPGFAPQRRGLRCIVTFVRGQVLAMRALARGDRDGAVRLALDAVCTTAFEVGRSLPNDRQDG
jgi:GT2 family glycosyltransferase